MAKHPAGTGGHGPEEPLLSTETGLFELNNRPRRDVPWLVAYLLVLATAVGGGIFSFMHRNTNYSELLNPHKMSDPATCPLHANPATRRLLQQGPDAPSPFDLDLFMVAAGAWLAASAGGAILVGLLFIWLVRVTPAGLVGVALGLQVIVPTVMGVVALTQNAMVPGLLLLLLAGLMVLLIVLWQQQIRLVTKLLGLAGHGLAANPGLVPAALGLQVGLVGLLELPLLLAGIAAYMNGTLGYNPARQDQGKATSAEGCVDENGDQVFCCAWQTEPWVPPFIAITTVAMTWSLFLVFQVKLFMVAGATAQWYFTPPSALSSGSRGRPSRTLTSLRFALGPSLGSLCCGSAILTAVELIRKALQKAREERGRNVVAACAAACLSLLLQLVEFLTRFATVRAAITGEAFFQAGRNVVALLSRNAMNAFGVWWLPPMILQSCCFILSVGWAAAVFGLSYATTWSRQAAAAPDQAAISAFLTAAIALLASWAVLGFLASLLLNVVETLFVCFAMDRDAGQVTSPEVHQVLVLLPTVGAVVQQPDGGLAYGAPPPQQQRVSGSRAYNQV